MYAAYGARPIRCAPASMNLQHPGRPAPTPIRRRFRRRYTHCCAPVRTPAGTDYACICEHLAIALRTSPEMRAYPGWSSPRIFRGPAPRTAFQAHTSNLGKRVLWGDSLFDYRIAALDRAVGAGLLPLSLAATIESCIRRELLAVQQREICEGSQGSLRIDSPALHVWRRVSIRRTVRH